MSSTCGLPQFRRTPRAAAPTEATRFRVRSARHRSHPRAAKDLGASADAGAAAAAGVEIKVRGRAEALGGIRASCPPEIAGELSVTDVLRGVGDRMNEPVPHGDLSGPGSHRTLPLSIEPPI